MRRMSPLLAAALAALAACLPSAARAAATARVVEWGELHAEPVGPLGPEFQEQALSPGTATRDPQFTRRTDTVEARLCQQFGVAVQVQAGPGDALPRAFQVRIRHPRLTRPDGASGTEDSVLTFIEPRPQPDGAQWGWTAFSFTFDNEWEMRPGAWTFEFRDGDAVVASKTFTVTLPPDGVARSACGPAPVS